MRKRRKDMPLPFDAKGLAPPPAWQVAAPKLLSESSELPPPPEPPDVWPQTASQIRGKSFPEARRGYSPKQVSTYLEYVADDLGSFERHSWQTRGTDLPTPRSDQIRRRQFATVRRGFDIPSVRRYLEQLAAQVEALERSIGRA
jgi:DivIVA domain-containing protein